MGNAGYLPHRTKKHSFSLPKGQYAGSPINEALTSKQTLAQGTQLKHMFLLKKKLLQNDRTDRAPQNEPWQVCLRL